MSECVDGVDSVDSVGVLTNSKMLAKKNSVLSRAADNAAAMSGPQEIQEIQETKKAPAKPKPPAIAQAKLAKAKIAKAKIAKAKIAKAKLAPNHLRFAVNLDKSSRGLTVLQAKISRRKSIFFEDTSFRGVLNRTPGERMEHI